MNNEFNQGSIKEKLQVLQDNMNQSQQQKLSAGDCTISIMRIITCIILFAVLAACLYGLSIGVDYLNFKEKENNVTAGKIIEKSGRMEQRSDRQHTTLQLNGIMTKTGKILQGKNTLRLNVMFISVMW